MLYAVLMLWNERWKFMPAILAVAVSAVLVSIQFGLLAGTLSFTSQVIDRSSADIWIGCKDVPSIDAAMPVPESWRARFGGLPAVSANESLLYGFAACSLDAGGTAICCVVGSALGGAATGRVAGLTPENAARLAAPLTVVVDEGDLVRLGLTTGVGESIKVTQCRLRVVGTTRGYKSIGGPFVFCSRATARRLLPMYAGSPGDASFWLVRCRDEASVPEVVRTLRERYDDMAVITRDEFSASTQRYWLTRSKAGIAMGFTAFLALLVSLVITSQTLYSATMASIKQFATLAALGFSRWKLGQLVLYQAFLVGLFGLMLALPLDFGAARLVGLIGGKVLLPGWLIVGTIIMTMVTAIQAGLWALKSLRHIEPISLLR